jgi:hypothetical protein
MAEKFCRKWRLPRHYLVLLHAVKHDMGQTALLPLRRKACWGFFGPKNPTASAGFEPASTLHLDHRRRSLQTWKTIILYRISQYFFSKAQNFSIITISWLRRQLIFFVPYQHIRLKQVVWVKERRLTYWVLYIAFAIKFVLHVVICILRHLVLSVLWLLSAALRIYKSVKTAHLVGGITLPIWLPRSESLSVETTCLTSSQISQLHSSPSNYEHWLKSVACSLSLTLHVFLPSVDTKAAVNVKRDRDREGIHVEWKPK